MVIEAHFLFPIGLHVSNTDEDEEGSAQSNYWGPCQKCLAHVLDKPIEVEGVFALQ